MTGDAPRSGIHCVSHLTGRSSNGAQTEIHAQSRVHVGPETIAPVLAAPVMEAQAQISAAMEAITMRPGMVV
jgi:hypothetical protein